jgi:parvulin-like peptidyl-prolyl isomerase
MSVASKVTVDLPELRAYYFENRDHESFKRGPEQAWRELVVKFANHPTREAARAKLDEARARLERGEPFDRVARELSEGPNADQGGLWTTAPGSYAVAEVNAALASMEPGQTSGPIEGPTGLHVVLLESRRPAGRMSFEEVQDEIRAIIKARKEAELIDEYLTDLYRGAVVTTVFSEYVPRHLREDSAGG